MFLDVLQIKWVFAQSLYFLLEEENEIFKIQKERKISSTIYYSESRLMLSPVNVIIRLM
jgi:hypothetical protein